jgi:hypothetical protein
VHTRQAHDLGPQNLHPRQGDGERFGFGQAKLGQASGRFRPDIGVENPGTRGLRGRLMQINPTVAGRQGEAVFILGKIGNQSSPS